MSLITEALPDSSVKNESLLENYLSERAQLSDFVMVEFGHGSIPVAYQQPGGFTGNRAYIGVEAWLRDPYLRQRSYLEGLRLAGQGQNIFYIDHDTQGQVVREDDRSERYAYYQGPYSAATSLPETCASEVLFGNCFGDPLIAHHKGSTSAMLTEANRILSDDGMVVIRETITPSYVQLRNKLISGSGLTIVEKVDRSNKDSWQTLETVYNGEITNTYAKEDSFYLFLSKLSGRFLNKVV